MPKPPYSRVKLRVSWGEMPEFSDILEFPSGRRYQVVGFRGTRGIDCLVLPPGAPENGARVLSWSWASRKRKARQ